MPCTEGFEVSFGPGSEPGVKPLTQLCLVLVTGLLKEEYWSQKDIEKHNPFSFLPQTLVGQLFDYVISWPSLAPSLPYTYPLLTSNKIKIFCLPRGVYLKWDEFIAILNTLSDHAILLNELILKPYIKYDQGFPENIARVFRKRAVKSAINHLILSSPNLEKLESSFSFDLKCIPRIHKLKTLELNFKCNLSEMILKMGNAYATNDTITQFSCQLEKRKLDEFMFILQHWIGLTCVKTNIADALEHYHGRELVNGTLSKRYKLQDIMLGSESRCLEPAIKIAALTCPDVRHLELITPQGGAIAALSNFQNIEILSIEYPLQYVPDEVMGDFQLELKLVLESIGAKLKKLKMVGIHNIDLSVIGHFCPILTHLEISRGSIFTSDTVPCFEHLQDLILRRGNFSKETLLRFLPQCKIVSSVYFNISCLDDDVLKQLLSLNVWPELKSATFSTHDINSTLGGILHQYSPSAYIRHYLCGCTYEDSFCLGEIFMSAHE